MKQEDEKDQGRDIFSAVLYGMRISLWVGVLGTLFSAALGIALGLVAGYVGGAVDALIMRAADVQLTFPAILIALIVDGVVKSLNVEAPGKFEISDAENLLKQL